MNKFQFEQLSLILKLTSEAPFLIKDVEVPPTSKEPPDELLLK